MYEIGDFMKFLYYIFFLFSIQFSYAISKTNCDKAFVDLPTHQQFVETLVSHFSTDKNTLKKHNFQPISDTTFNSKTHRKETLRYLVAMGYLTVENSRVSNPLFDYILNKPASEVIQLIRDNPHLLYEGILMGLPPFFLIVFIGDKSVTEASIEIDKTLVNSKNAMEETPLHYTIDPEIAMSLLYYNAKPDAQDRKGRVALHNMRNPETVETMLYYKANPTIKDRSGISPIKYHEKFVGNQEIITLLKQARETKRSTKNNHTAPITELGSADIKTVNRVEEAKKAVEIRRIEEEKKAEEIRKAEKVQKATEARQKIIEDQKNQILSEVIKMMAAALIKKAVVNRIMTQIIGNNNQPLIDFLQNKIPVLPNIIESQEQFDKEVEKKTNAVFTRAITNIQTQVRGVTPEFIDKLRDTLAGEMENIIIEMENRLTDSIKHAQIKTMKKHLKAIKHYLSESDKVIYFLVRAKTNNDLWLQYSRGTQNLGSTSPIHNIIF